MKKLTDEELLAVWWDEIYSTHVAMAALAKDYRNGTADTQPPSDYHYYAGFVSGLKFCLEDLERRSVPDYRKLKKD